jgi:hypothetical protein
MTPRLFLSARAVQYHPSKVFTKLAINSSSQLDRALPGIERYALPDAVREDYLSSYDGNRMAEPPEHRSLARPARSASPSMVSLPAPVRRPSRGPWPAGAPGCARRRQVGVRRSQAHDGPARDLTLLAGI